MLCNNCKNLAFLVTKRICIKCGIDVLNNISVLCELCSNTDRICSVCLKKIHEMIKHNYQGCNHCGK